MPRGPDPACQNLQYGPEGVLSKLKPTYIFFSLVLAGIYEAGSLMFHHCLACQIGDIR